MTLVAMAVGSLTSVLSVQVVASGQSRSDQLETSQGPLTVVPISHATLALRWNKLTIYVDPVGGVEAFKGLPQPDLILVTDIHGDHLNVDTLTAIRAETTKIVAPAAVAEKLPDALSQATRVLANGEEADVLGVAIRAVPMYNLTPERLKFHAKGRGNGYVLTLGDRRVYLSGDTEDIPEMRALKGIDVAFLCMNLPYTMTVEQAASAAREFRPKIVYPYHYRGSDIDQFRRLVGSDLDIEVRLREWYPSK
jgi:L-ascorbate metabolism protein UlaG (beta-lactamase superfamily)